MRKRLLFFTNLLFSSLFVMAGNDNYPVGARSLGMANASVTQRDFWSLQQNQAGIAAFKSVAGGVYVENKFQLADLSVKAAGIVLPVAHKYVLGLSATSYGNNLYSEKKVGLALAGSLSDKLYAAIQLDYLNTSIAENYGSKNAFAGEVGIQAQLSRNLRVGAHIYNPTKTKLANYNDERVPTIMKIGFAYIFSEKVMLAIEGEGELTNKPFLKAGLEYHPVKQVYLRTGIANNLQSGAFGMGIDFRSFKFDIAANMHQTLGFTTAVSIIFTKVGLPAF